MYTFIKYPKIDNTMVYRWCNDNCLGKWFIKNNVRYDNPPGQTEYWNYADEYCFENSNDAMLFKLRWA